jgi:hypothetical protein
MRNAAEDAEQWFLRRMALQRVSALQCGPQPWPAEARPVGLHILFKTRLLGGRAPQAASEIIRNISSR